MKHLRTRLLKGVFFFNANKAKKYTKVKLVEGELYTPVGQIYRVVMYTGSITQISLEYGSLPPNI